MLEFITESPIQSQLLNILFLFPESRVSTLLRRVNHSHKDQ